MTLKALTAGGKLPGLRWGMWLCCERSLICRVASGLQAVKPKGERLGGGRYRWQADLLCWCELSQLLVCGHGLTWLVCCLEVNFRSHPLNFSQWIFVVVDAHASLKARHTVVGRAGRRQHGQQLRMLSEGGGKTTQRVGDWHLVPAEDCHSCIFPCHQPPAFQLIRVALVLLVLFEAIFNESNYSACFLTTICWFLHRHHFIFVYYTVAQIISVGLPAIWSNTSKNRFGTL